MHDAYSNLRMANADGNNQQLPIIDEYVSKSNLIFAMPMYAVGIGIFLLYTCFKVNLNNLIELSHNLYFSIGINEMIKKRKLGIDFQLRIFIGMVIKENLNMKLKVIRVKMKIMKILMLVLSFIIV